MSARQWKHRLEETNSKLGTAIQSATEWRKVAENRLTIIRQLDTTIREQLKALQTVGEIFGVKVSLDPAVWATTDHLDAGGTAMFIMGKVEATSLYLRDLMAEASAIQVTLADTYALASEAVGIPRPREDLTVPDALSMTAQPSSPLTELGEDLNDLSEGPPEEDDPSWRHPQVTFPSEKSEGPSAALALFKRG